MDFILGLSRTLKGYTVIWVIIDRLTKSVLFLYGKATYTVDNWDAYTRRKLLDFMEFLCQMYQIETHTLR